MADIIKSTVYMLIALWLLSLARGQFKDHMQEFDAECFGEDMLQCASGGCVPYTQYCDGRIDCDDGTDENYCHDHKPDSKFCNESHQFLCADGRRCVHNYWLCNGAEDCDDGSDEANCTASHINNNATCKGFMCGDGKCISQLWVCDGTYDCADKSDEYTQDMCRHTMVSTATHDGTYCQELSGNKRYYRCEDMSFCLPSELMCDGMKDCRDGSDEGPFCANWHTMCNNTTCGGNGTECTPDRNGPNCICQYYYSMKQYNHTTRRCDDVDECLMERPHCSHKCLNMDGLYKCQCDDGYTKDQFDYLCYAVGPEALLFFSTRNEIRYLKVKSKQMVTVATGIKDAHGVSFDGRYLYWVQTAQGHQAIVRAHLEDVEGTKEVLVGVGLEDPGDIAVDWQGGSVYFSDVQRGAIFACRCDGSYCTTIHTHTKHPRFVTLDVRNGMMYWADWHNHPLIMSARMDGSEPAVLVDTLKTFATGLTIDVPNERLYFVDRTVKVVMIHDKKVYSLFEEPFHHPYAISVFENTVFWSDWTSNTIQTTDKLHSSAQKRNVLLSLDTSVIDMHIYHPVLMRATTNPCQNHNCSHFCFLTSNTTHVCACPDGMELRNNTCIQMSEYHPQYLIVGGGQLFTRLQYDALGNPETHATHFDIGRVQALAYDNVRDALYIYDGQRKCINYIAMKDFTGGYTRVLLHSGLSNVVDMDYDYVTDSLYILDAGRGSVEVLSLRSKQRALVHRFKANEVPVSLCVLPDYGRMLVAIENDQTVYIDTMGLDGEGRQHLLVNNLKGPRLRVRYAQNMDNVYISDEGNSVIDYMHPEGTGREAFRELSTTITSLAVTDMYVFWTDRRTSRLFWSDIHETTHKIRRIELSIFPNNTQLLLQSTSQPPDSKSPLANHPCLQNVCSDVCTQVAHSPPHQSTFHMGYKCHCPPGLLIDGNNCSKPVNCKDYELHCHRSNVCFPKHVRCDGKKDCAFGEDEEGCLAKPSICSPFEILCNGGCVEGSSCSSQGDGIQSDHCTSLEFQCVNNSICVSRSQLCDGRHDCPDGSDEDPDHCDTLACHETEFMCTSGSCILKSWQCDGEQDCGDASDEADCEGIQCGAGFYQCDSRECVELYKRCDGQQDCLDFSDEQDCEPIIVEFKEVPFRCAPWEYTCELNTSICLPLSARCNMKVECPGGTDEAGCEYTCAPRGLFACRQQQLCLPSMRVCDGRRDCLDGTDETPDACASVNRTSHLFPSLYPAAECHDGFLCRSGQCIQWSEVCDNVPNCFDGSDEGELCVTACMNSSCSHACQPSPQGQRCVCPEGFTPGAAGSCVDVDECSADYSPCSQRCTNVPGSFICSCHRGYAPRSDRRLCKAVRGNMSIVYVSGNTVRSISSDGYGAVEYNDATIASITDLDVNVRKKKLYVISPDAGKLVEVDGEVADKLVTVTNVGRPARVAVEWVSGNVYMVDSTPGASCIRVCNVKRKRCAKLHKLPSDANVSALIVDPKSARMFYCVTRELESVVWSATLAGREVIDLTTVGNCTGLAVDSFTSKLYVSETGPAHIIRMDFEGERHKKILADHPQLQAPHSLAIFEDSIYYLVANSFKLGRCRLFGPKHCETYIYRVFDANTFVIRHESVQRDDIEDKCEGFICANVCVLGANGPQCVCDDGSLAKDGACGLVKKTELALFNGWTHQDFSSHHVSFTVITAVLVLLAAYIAIFIYYHFVYKPRRNRPSAYTEVRFQNSPEGSTLLCNPSALDANGESPHEFVNPLQYVRNIWHQSFRRPNRPAGTQGLSIDVPHLPPQDFSDTESDFDYRENKKLFKNNIIR